MENNSFLYNDRSNYTQEEVIDFNRKFLLRHKQQYSLGGTNNLNVSWSDDEWQEYFTTHKGNYQELNLDLDF